MSISGPAPYINPVSVSAVQYPRAVHSNLFLGINSKKMKKFKVISSNPSNEGKTFVTKLYSETIVSTAFGDKRKRETYYVSGSKQIAVSSSVSLDTNEWNVVERPFEIEGNTIPCKWLHLGNAVPTVSITAPVEEKEDAAI